MKYLLYTELRCAKVGNWSLRETFMKYTEIFLRSSVTLVPLSQHLAIHLYMYIYKRSCQCVCLYVCLYHHSSQTSRWISLKLGMMVGFDPT